MAKVTAFGWDQTECAEVAGKITAFLTARTTYETDNSTGNHIAKNEAKGEAVDAMRGFGGALCAVNRAQVSLMRRRAHALPRSTASGVAHQRLRRRRAGGVDRGGIRLGILSPDLKTKEDLKYDG